MNPPRWLYIVLKYRSSLMCFALADYHRYGTIPKIKLQMWLNVTVVRNDFIEKVEISLTLFLRRNRVALDIVLAALNLTLIDLRRLYIIVQF